MVFLADLFFFPWCNLFSAASQAERTCSSPLYSVFFFILVSVLIASVGLRKQITII